MGQKQEFCQQQYAHFYLGTSHGIMGIMGSYTIIKLLDIVIKWLFLTCDMIKGNKSDVANIVFEIQAERGDIVMLYIV